MFALKKLLQSSLTRVVKIRKMAGLGIVFLAMGGMSACSADFSEFAGAAGGATGELICAVVQLLAECDS